MESIRKYWAHTANAVGEWHDLRQHLCGVAELARRFAQSYGAGDWAYAAGLWHDLGKFSQAFQDYLRGVSTDAAHAAEVRGSVDHTSAGAQHAAETYEVTGHLLAYAIAGHHAGLLDAVSEGACLERRLKKAVDPWKHGLELLDQPPRPSCLRF